MQSRLSPSHRNNARSLFCVVGGVVTGAGGWSGNPLLLPVGILFPGFWANAPNRLVAALVAVAHFLAASRGLPQGVSIFYGSQYAIGLGLWVAASTMFVAVHAVLWTKAPGWQKPVRYLAAAILMSVPPFGIAGWAGPITAAGILFPGWGWFGLVATAMLLAVMTTRRWTIAVALSAGLTFWSAAFWTMPKMPDGWAGINTDFRFDQSGQYADFSQHQKTIALVRSAATSGSKTIVLPESALGIWTPTTERLWQRSLSDLSIAVIGGAVILDPAGYDSVLIELKDGKSRVLYRERMPVPVSMWQPWSRLWGKPEGAHAYFFENPVADLLDYRVAPLICYEQLIIWPVLQSIWNGADMIIATGNDWWTGESNIGAIQKASAVAWARLFDVPLVLAFNE